MDDVRDLRAWNTITLLMACGRDGEEEALAITRHCSSLDSEFFTTSVRVSWTPFGVRTWVVTLDQGSAMSSLGLVNWRNGARAYAPQTVQVGVFFCLSGFQNGY